MSLTLDGIKAVFIRTNPVNQGPFRTPGAVNNRVPNEMFGDAKVTDQIRSSDFSGIGRIDAISRMPRAQFDNSADVQTVDQMDFSYAFRRDLDSGALAAEMYAKQIGMVPGRQNPLQERVNIHPNQAVAFGSLFELNPPIHYDPFANMPI